MSMNPLRTTILRRVTQISSRRVLCSQSNRPVMTPEAVDGKRKATAPISPPPTKRSIPSGTTKSAVSSFFTPTSQKPKDATKWSERKDEPDKPPTLLVGWYNRPEKQDEDANAKDAPKKHRKIAAFDLDSTLIATSSGRKHAKDAADWRWWHPDVPGRLRALHEDGYRVAIFSNQGGITLHPAPESTTTKKKKGPAQQTQRAAEFKDKCAAVLRHLDLPDVIVYAATAKDGFRKPRTGMWREMLRDAGLAAEEVDVAASVFVGDAGGRVATTMNNGGGEGGVAAARDFSCSDRNFAANVGVAFQTPEEYFLGEAPRAFERDMDLLHYPFDFVTVDREKAEGKAATAAALFEKKAEREVVLLCGRPGAGKSTFYWTQLEPLGYERVNQDTLKTRDKCVQAAKGHLERGASVAIDNTNADPETRKLWVNLAKSFGVPIRCVLLTTPGPVCRHNEAVRSLNRTMNREGRTALPGVAFAGFDSRFKTPAESEGFDEVVRVDFRFQGSREEYEIWGRYWL